MYKLGLKLWSINTDNYYNQAIELYEKGVYDYIELYVVPDTLEHLDKWEKLNIPFIIHCPHFAHGFNLAKEEKEKSNLKIFSEVKKYADKLNAKYIVVHGGIDGSVFETARQFALLKDERALIENKPYAAIPNRMGGKLCRGYSPEEIAIIIETAKCGMCLDFGHAVCSANSLFDMNLNGIEVNNSNSEYSVDILTKNRINYIYSYIEKFLLFKPKMFHLTDNINMTSPYDSHLHLGFGELDFNKIKLFLPEDAIITLETDKNNRENIDDFIPDCEFMRKLQNV